MPQSQPASHDRASLTLQATARLELAQQAGGLAASLHDAQLLRVRQYWAVFVALYQDQSVIVKHFVSDGAADIVVATAAELERVCPQMSTGDLQINQLIAHDPAQGILVVSHVPDGSLIGAFDQPDADRAKLLEHCADWLTTYVDGRIATGQFAPFFWQEQLANTSFAALSSDDRQLAQTMRSKLRIHADKLRGFALQRVAGHGDFVPHNFCYDGGVLYGFDVQGETWRPLAQVLVQFLIQLGLQTPADERVNYVGLPEADVAALCMRAGLPDIEYETVFRYLAGWHMCVLLVRYAHRPERVARLRAMITDALADWPV